MLSHPSLHMMRDLVRSSFRGVVEGVVGGKVARETFNLLWRKLSHAAFLKIGNRRKIRGLLNLFIIVVYFRP